MRAGPSNHRTVGHRGDDQPSLGIEREPIGTDEENREADADGLVPNIANILAGVAALLEDDGKTARVSSIGSPGIDRFRKRIQLHTFPNYA